MIRYDDTYMTIYYMTVVINSLTSVKMNNNAFFRRKCKLRLRTSGGFIDPSLIVILNNGLE